MIRAYLGRFSVIGIVVGLLGLAWALKGVEFGQDLAGGAELRYGVTRRITERYKTLVRYREEFKNPEKVEQKRGRIAEIKEKLEDASGPEADRLKRESEEFEFALDPDALREAIDDLREQQAKVAQGTDIVRRRLDPAGTSDIEVRTIGGNQLLIRIPYQRRSDETEEEAETRFKKKIAEIQDLVERQGELRFHIALKREDHGNIYEDAELRAREGRAASESYLYVVPEDQYKEIQGKLSERGITDPVSAGYIPWSSPPKDKIGDAKGQSREPLLIHRKHELDGTIVDRAFVSFGDKGVEISMEFTAAGRGRFESLTARHAEEKSQLAIVLDDVCHSAPQIQERIAGSARVSGDFTRAEAESLATVLTAGSLPVQIERLKESVVGPSLGRDSIRAGMSAALIGAGAVLFFMLFYYLAGGVVANISLIFNIVIIFGALAAFNAKLTLPGIAGLVLTIGMAVDASVLIFERIREEKARGRTLRLAVQAGYDRAFVTIMDANLTTLITAVILYWFGTGPVRGFAVILTLGILGSLFTSLYASRVIVEFLVAKGWIKEFAMLRVIGRPKLSFMRARPLAYMLSALLVGGGLVSFFTYRDKYGIDFEGGTMLMVSLREEIKDEEMRRVADAALDRMQMRENDEAAEDGRAPLDFGRVRTQAFEESLAAKWGSASGTYSIISRLDVDQLGEYRELLGGLLEGELDPDNPFPSQESIGQAVSQELGSAAVTAIFFSILLIFLYIVMRFEFNPSFGVGAVVALAHDVVITAGAMALVDRLGILPAKIDLPAVAALLTIMGYSLNDTIVVFDRIREARATAGRDKPLKDIVDEAVNAVLSRSLITSFTTALAAGALFVFGGDATRGFSFAILVGVLVGTYSSIFVASPIVVEWEALRQKPRLKRGLFIAAACVVVLALAGLVAQSVLTRHEYDRQEACRLKIEKIDLALRAYAARHEGEYPADLETLLRQEYLEASALAGPDSDTGVAYDYVSGLRTNDPPECVLLYDTEGLHRYGGDVLFADGRLLWKDGRRISSLVRMTTRKTGGKPGRRIRIIRAEAAAADRRR